MASDALKSFIKRNNIKLSTFFIFCGLFVALLVVLIWGGVTNWEFIKQKETEAPSGAPYGAPSGAPYGR